MTSHRNKCSLSSLLPMSCRGGAEAFARHLQSRLSSLGSNDSNGTADESSWLAAPENSVTLSQPRQTESEIYFDFGDLESPGSPEEELEDPELENLINQDNLKLLHNPDCHCIITKEKSLNLFETVKTTSFDSDSSDGPFYDSENDVNQQTLTQQFNNTPQSHNILKKTNGTDKINNETTVDKLNEILAECTHSQCSLPLNNEDSVLSVEDESNLAEFNTYSLKVYQKDEGQHKTSANTENNNVVINSNSVKVEKNLPLESSDAIGCSSQQFEHSEFEDSVSYSVNNSDNTDDDVENSVPRVRRCSSLKTGKTPPGTPGRKKIVRFADVLGLDLADVRTFLDEIPKIPNSAYNDLRNVDFNDSSNSSNLNISVEFNDLKDKKLLIPLFQQPGGQPDFIDRVRENQVCLDNALVADPVASTITGTVRVKNLDFHKSVHIRYSLDSWQSFADVQAGYVENSCDGFSDKFSFLLFAHNLSVGQKLEFAIRFQCKGCQYWDNNNGTNYCFQCLPTANTTRSTEVTGIDDNWSPGFYY